MGRHIDLLVCPKKARMDIAYRDLQVVILLHPADHRLIGLNIAKIRYWPVKQFFYPRA